MKPFSIVIGLKPYSVKFKKKIVEEGIECDGLCKYEERELLLRKGQTDDNLLASFWHEFSHACLYEMDQEELADNESFVENLSQNIARAYRALQAELAK